VDFHLCGNRLSTVLAAFTFLLTQCDSEQTRQNQKPILNPDEAMEQEQPEQDVTSGAARMKAQPDFGIQKQRTYT